MKNAESHSFIAIADLAAPFVRMPDDEAVAILHQHYGLRGALTRLATEKDETFRVDGDDHRRYILKIGNPVEPQAEIDLQVAVLEHVALHDNAIPVPRVVSNRAGGLHARIRDRAGQSRPLRLMSYLPGTPLDSQASTPLQREAIGAMLARLRLCMSNFEHTAAQRTLAWDVKNLPSLAYLAGGVREPGHCSQLERGLERFESIASRVGQLRTQVLHNDFSKSNIVVDPDTDQFVTGVIDFGDTVHTAIAIDVSTALLNQLPRNTGVLPEGDFLADARDLLRGYLRVASLTDEELALVPHLVMARIITRALVSTHLAENFPDNADYLLRNTVQGWAQLDWFLQQSPEAISGTLINTL